MNEEIIEEILKECGGWKERLLVKLFPSMFIETYKTGMRKGFKWNNIDVQ